MPQSLYQQIINLLYRYPRSTLKKYQRFGGYLAYKSMLAAEAKMRAAAPKLPPVRSYSDKPLIFFLTGKKFLHQTLFCTYSLTKFSGEKFQFVIVDDGSFDAEIIKLIEQQLPGAQIVTAGDIDKNLNEKLPITKYPHLRAKRLIYPHLRKLTDIHTIDMPGWKLVFDSDMLFWNEPKAIINWLLNPNQPIFMKDCMASYGYTPSLMSGLSGGCIPNMLNVGVIGLNGEAINWVKVQDWMLALEAEQGTSYYLEQALTAMLIGSKQSIQLDAATYQVCPKQLGLQGIVLQHYVDLSKKLYFKEAWRALV